ncbi:hypothetical protein VNO80_21337 [Phaseolus coccineus]|uniref:Uncharacterized protein n=1 Tax=Phaseolus coccineus TaxID=3886 RepID=A0AAN9M328_PHACN
MDAWQILNRLSCLTRVQHCIKAADFFSSFIICCLVRHVSLDRNKQSLLVGFIMESVTRQQNRRDLKLVGGVMGPNEVKQNSPNNNS